MGLLCQARATERDLPERGLTNQHKWRGAVRRTFIRAENMHRPAPTFCDC